MLYEEFVTTVQSKLKMRLGTSYHVTIQKVPKNNGTMLDGLCITKPGQKVSPTIYLNSFYERWKSGTAMTCILEELINIYSEESSIPQLDSGLLHDFKNLRDKVAFKLVHTASNREMLKDLPSIPFLDLSLIFYLYLNENEYGHMTATIHNSHMKSWGVTPNELYRLAMKNTPRLLPAELKSMEEVIRELCAIQMDDDFIRQLIREQAQVEEPTPLYVLSNTCGVNGACAMLYESALKNFADLLEQDLLILPSSIHEVLLLPYAEDICMEDLFQMVRHVNQTEVPVEDRLSDEVYRYKRAEDCITAIPRLSKYQTS